MINYNNSEFLLSAAGSGQFLRGGGFPTIAIAGRSNVGKSSVINSLVRRKNFARTSAQPGKTAHVNYFKVDETFYLADLPGYGYAKVSKSEKERWARLMESFFAESGLITAGILIVDARHKPTGDDVTMCNWFKGTGVPLLAVANKLDKLKKSEIEPNLKRIEDTLNLVLTQLLPYSAETNYNRDKLEESIAGLLQTA
ncbi:MAG: ribosome biogenesis GTP-binding protein YihA/YsxC [Oscillospiraceae bacterium]|jgi:GTP-binding protein|nr:ribosome biogenesis GTP-binding protein YihA/YsxC [Oscillospiraceae bacterium]